MKRWFNQVSLGFKNSRDLFEFARGFRKVRSNHPPAAPGAKRILFVGSGGLGRTQIELCFMESLLRERTAVSVLTWPKPHLVKILGLQPAVKVRFWHEFLGEISEERLGAAWATVGGIWDFIGLEIDGIRIGLHAINSAIRAENRGSFDLENPADRETLNGYLRIAMQAAEASRKILDELRPDVIYFGDYGYNLAGSLFDQARQRSIKIVGQWFSHKSDCLVFKNIAPDNPDADAGAVGDEMWRRLKATEWDEARSHRLRDELDASYRRGEWFNMVSKTVRLADQNSEPFIRELGLDSSRKTAVIFCPMLTDSPLYYGRSLFSSYEEWMIATVGEAVRNPELNWILKLHPGNLSAMDGVNKYGDSLELAALSRHFPELPAHIRVIRSDASCPAALLYRSIDYVITPRGTAGIEGALAGRAVVTAGTGRYDGKGFTFDSDSVEQYLGLLSDLQNRSLPGDAERVLAEKCAAGLFLLKPVGFASLQIAQRGDFACTFAVRLRVRTRETFGRCPDLRKLNRWILEGETEDLEGDPGFAPAEKVSLSPA